MMTSYQAIPDIFASDYSTLDTISTPTTFKKKWIYLTVLAIASFMFGYAFTLKGDRFLGDETTTYKAWSSSSADFVYPELRTGVTGLSPDLMAVNAALKGKADLAICLSGGGTRAAISAAGWIRGLKYNGILKKAKYITSNSGGGWFNGVFSFADVPLDELLGSYIEPARLTKANMLNFMQKAPKSFESTLYNSETLFVSNLLNKFLSFSAKASANVLMNIWTIGFKYTFDNSFKDPWLTAVSDIILKPYKISGFETISPKSSASTLKVLKSKCCDAESDFPFPIFVGSLQEEYAKLEKSKFVYASLEATPYYIGLPEALGSEHVFGNFGEEFGTLFVEPGAFGKDVIKGSYRLNLDQEVIDVKNLNPPSMISSLDSIISISSNAPGLGLVNKFTTSSTMNFPITRLMEWVCPSINFWAKGTARGPEKTFTMKAVDGGATDNLAIYPALRRGVKNLIVFNAMVENDMDSLVQGKGVFGDLASYFGALDVDSDSDFEHGFGESDSRSRVTINQLSKVFVKSGTETDSNQAWEEFLNGVIDCFPASVASSPAAASHASGAAAALARSSSMVTEVGAPCVMVMKPFFKQSLYVLENKFQGIKGGYSVNVMWIFNIASTAWKNLLDDESKMYINTELPNKCNTMKARIQRSAGKISSSLQKYLDASNFKKCIFPNLYTIPEVNKGTNVDNFRDISLLSQLATYNVYMAASEIESMIAAPATQASPAAVDQAVMNDALTSMQKTRSPAANPPHVSSSKANPAVVNTKKAK